MVSSAAPGSVGVGAGAGPAEGDGRGGSPSPEEVLHRAQAIQGYLCSFEAQVRRRWRAGVASRVGAASLHGMWLMQEVVGVFPVCRSPCSGTWCAAALSVGRPAGYRSTAFDASGPGPVTDHKQGLPVIHVKYGNFGEALDILHEYVLMCIQVRRNPLGKECTVWRRNGAL